MLDRTLAVDLRHKKGGSNARIVKSPASKKRNRGRVTCGAAYRALWSYYNGGCNYCCLHTTSTSRTPAVLASLPITATYKDAKHIRITATATAATVTTTTSCLLYSTDLTLPSRLSADDRREK
eukprot:2486294-Pleurochrysis_carterae.AAC.1